MVKSTHDSGKLLLLILGLFVLSLSFGLLVGGCSSDEEKAEGTEEETGQPANNYEVVKTTILAANTSMLVTLNTQVSTSESKIGDKVSATVKGPSETGQTLNIPAGTVLEGIVSDVNDGKAEGAKAFMKLKFTKMILPGEGSVPMEGIVVTKDGSGVIYPGAQGTSIARDAGIGAVAGGVIGGVAGGEAKDAIKGAAVGAVAGGVLGAVLHQDQVTLKVGREFDVVTTAPVVKVTRK